MFVVSVKKCVIRRRYQSIDFGSTRDIFRMRDEKGEFNLFNEMHESFHHNFRMNPPTKFELLLNKVDQK